jgi:hypothetical protein
LLGLDGHAPPDPWTLPEHTASGISPTGESTWIAATWEATAWIAATRVATISVATPWIAATWIATSPIAAAWEATARVTLPCAISPVGTGHSTQSVATNADAHSRTDPDAKSWGETRAHSHAGSAAITTKLPEGGHGEGE